MKATELIRGLLDLIDQYEKPEVNVTAVKVDTGVDEPFAMIKNLLQSRSNSDVQNRPNEAYSGIEAVTTDAGGGLNGPKHPDDLRGSTVNIYPRGS